jgi:hypothetical protein
VVPATPAFTCLTKCCVRSATRVYYQHLCSSLSRTIRWLSCDPCSFSFSVRCSVEFIEQDNLHHLWTFMHCTWCMARCSSSLVSSLSLFIFFATNLRPYLCGLSGKLSTGRLRPLQLGRLLQNRPFLFDCGQFREPDSIQSLDVNFYRCVRWIH